MSVLDTSPITIDSEEGNHDRFAHWANKHAITEAAVTGSLVVALCGKRFNPIRDPEKYPVCPTCQEIKTGRYVPGNH